MLEEGGVKMKRCLMNCEVIDRECFVRETVYDHFDFVFCFGGSFYCHAAFVVSIFLCHSKYCTPGVDSVV